MASQVASQIPRIGGGICMFSTDRYKAIYRESAISIIGSIDRDIFWLYIDYEI